MCGICGFVGSFNKQKFKELFVEHESRGKDASGIAWYNQRKSLCWNKQPITVSRFVTTKEYLICENDNPSMVIAHTRAATQGDKSDNRNNHPFINKNQQIAFCHNGIITNYEHLRQNVICDGQCDSEVILSTIVLNLQKKMDIIKAIEQSVNKLCGSYNFSLLYKNKLFVFSDGNINFVKTDNGIYFCQTGEKTLSLKDGLFSSLLSYHLDANKLAVLSYNNNKVKMEVRKLKIFKKQYDWTQNTYYNRIGSYYRNDIDNNGGYTGYNYSNYEYLNENRDSYCDFLGGNCSEKHNKENCKKCSLRTMFRKSEDDEVLL